MEKGLNPRQEAFVNAYAAGGFSNGTQAAIEAGYAERCARVTAAKLLTKANIKAAVEARRKPAQEAAIVDAAYVLRKLKEVVEVNSTRYAKLDFAGDPVTDEFGQQTFRMVDAAAANAALRTLAMAIGLGKEKEDKDATIAALAVSLQEALGHGKS